MGDVWQARRVLNRVPEHTPAAGAGSWQDLGDDEIVKALRRGEAMVFEALYRRTYPAVTRTLRRIGQFSHADHEDLVQVTFERLITTLNEHRFAGACSLSTWASSIAGNVALDLLRARTRERRLFSTRETQDGSEGVRSGGRELERSLEARAELRRLHAILSRMNAHQAKAIILHDVLGHELSEVAVVTGVSEAAAQSRLVRGRKELVRRCRAKIARGESDAALNDSKAEPKGTGR